MKLILLDNQPRPSRKDETGELDYFKGLFSKACIDLGTLAIPR